MSLWLILFSIAPGGAQDAHWVQVAAARTMIEAPAVLADQASRSPMLAEDVARGRYEFRLYQDHRGEYWRILIGPMPDRATAQAYCANLRAWLVDCLAR